jgi:hypothetical protein
MVVTSIGTGPMPVWASPSRRRQDRGERYSADDGSPADFAVARSWRPSCGNIIKSGTASSDDGNTTSGDSRFDLPVRSRRQPADGDPCTATMRGPGAALVPTVQNRGEVAVADQNNMTDDTKDVNGNG